MIRLTVASFLLVLLAVGPGTAAPGHKATIALPAIDNDDGDLRAAVADALEGPDLTLIGVRATNRAVDRLGEVTSLTEKQARKLTNELEVDAIVYGKLDTSDGKKKLRFKLFVKGKRQKGFSVQFTNARSKKFKTALREKMVEKISIATSNMAAEEAPRKKGKSQEDDEEEPVAKKGKKGKKGKRVATRDTDEDEKSAKNAKKGKRGKKGKKGKKSRKDEAKSDDEGEDDEQVAKGEDDEDEDSTDAEDDEDGERKGTKKVAALDDEDGAVEVRGRGKGKSAMHTPNRAAIRVDTGVSVASRQLAFTSTPDLANVNGEDLRPKPFKQAPVPGARLGVELYPLAFLDPDGFAAGLGGAIEYDRVLKSTVTVRGGDPVDDGKVSNVKQQLLVVGGRYRLPFGKTPTSPSVTVGFNYGRRTFKVQAGNLADRNNLDLPDTDYKYLSPLLGFRIPATASIAFYANGEAMLVRDAGPISKANSYGRAKVFGFDSAAGLDITLKNRIGVRLAFEFTQLGFTFTGGGELSKNRDGDDTTQDIGGALDRSMGGTVTVGGLY